MLLKRKNNQILFGEVKGENVRALLPEMMLMDKKSGMFASNTLCTYEKFNLDLFL